jgi:hypothetical protein
MDISKNQYRSTGGMAPEKYGPKEIRSLHENDIHTMKFMGAQISWGPYFSGTKFLGDKCLEHKFS